MVVGRDAHHVADDLKGKRAGEFGNHLAVTVWIPLDHLRDQSARAVPHEDSDPGHHPEG